MAAHIHLWLAATLSAVGHSLPGRASSKSSHVRYTLKAEVHSELGASAIGILHCNADVKSSQWPIESGTVPFQKT